jgi:Protein of unknown function (DUF3102)
MSEYTETADDTSFLAEHADEIRKLRKRGVSDAIEIGRRLTDAKARCGHNNRLPWLKREFTWSDQQARRFMHVYEFSKTNNLVNLEIDISGLYLLAAPRTSETARSEIIKLASLGEKMSAERVDGVIQEHKKKAKKAAREAAQAAFSDAEREEQVSGFSSGADRLEMEEQDGEACDEAAAELLNFFPDRMTPEGIANGLLDYDAPGAAQIANAIIAGAEKRRWDAAAFEAVKEALDEDGETLDGAPFETPSTAQSVPLMPFDNEGLDLPKNLRRSKVVH